MLATRYLSKFFVLMITPFIASSAYAGLPAQEVFKLSNQGFHQLPKALKEQYRELKNIDSSSLQTRIFKAGDKISIDLSTEQLKNSLRTGDSAFVPAGWIRPLQTVVSYYGVGINLFLKAGALAYPALKFDHGQSPQDISNAKAAVIGPNRDIYLLDGHHTFTASLLAGAKTFPVKIQGDYSAFSEAEFIEALIQKELAYLTDLQSGKITSTLKADFSELEDSPLRTWIDASGAEIPETSHPVREIRCETETPAWIRDANSMPPFAEFKVARILVEEGLTESTCPDCFKPAAKLSEKVNEVIRSYMIKAQDNHRFKDLLGVHVIPEKQNLKELDLNQITGFQGEYKIRIYQPPFFTTSP